MVQEIKKRKYYGGGWKPKPLTEKKVIVYGYVPRKHYLEVQSKINELVKPYRDK